MRGALRWTRLLLVWAIVSLFAGSFRDASLHPTDVQALVGARAVAALQIRGVGGSDANEVVAAGRGVETVRVSDARSATAFADTRLHVEPTRTTRFVVLVRRRFAEHAALLC